jgi:hypothetical protein
MGKINKASIVFEIKSMKENLVLVSSINVYSGKFCDINADYSMWFQVMHPQTYCKYGIGKLE